MWCQSEQAAMLPWGRAVISIAVAAAMTSTTATKFMYVTGDLILKKRLEENVIIRVSRAHVGRDPI